MFFRISVLSAAGTWAALGLASGLLYFLWEVFVYLKTRNAESTPRFGAIAHGLALWPIMLPEVVEYALAEIGVLKAPSLDNKTVDDEERAG